MFIRYAGLSFTMLVASASAWGSAEKLSQDLKQAAAKNYYGSELPALVQQPAESVEAELARSEAIKMKLYKVLRSAHIVKAGAPDQILESDRCPSNAENCVQRTYFNYKSARQHLFGDPALYLRGEEGKWKVEDVYCERELGQGETGGTDPGPGQIPFHEVINCEHTWPKSRFNAFRKEDTYEAQHNDLHHLFSTDNPENNLRNNHMLGKVDRSKPFQGSRCKPYNLPETEERKRYAPKGVVANVLGTALPQPGLPPIPSAYKTFELVGKQRGDTARAIFYFALRYRAHIEPLEEFYLRQWHQEDPIDDAEIARNNRIYEVQGTRNPLIDNPDLLNVIKDFSSQEYRSGAKPGPGDGGRDEDDSPKPPTDSKPPTTNPPTPPTTPVDAASLAPHVLENGVLKLNTLVDAEPYQLSNADEARRNPCFGVKNGAYSSYELLARRGDTVYRFKGDLGKTMSEEKLPKKVKDLEGFFKNKKINCEAKPGSDNLAPHTLNAQGLIVARQELSPLMEIPDVVEAKRNPCFNVSGVPYRRFEFFARTGNNKLVKLEPNRDGYKKTDEDLATDLDTFIKAKNIVCAAP